MDRNKINLDNLHRFLLDCQLTAGTFKGGLRDGRQLGTGHYQFLYVETTGYLITHFVNLYQETKVAEYQRRAMLAADFLVQILEGDKLPYNFDLKTKKADRRFFVFDNGICVQGLVDMYKLSRKKIYLQTAEKIAGWIVDEMWQEDGSFRAYYDANEDNSVHPGNDFSADGGCIQIKNAIAFLKLFEATKNKSYQHIAEKILDQGQVFQLKNGGFRVNQKTEAVFSHGHCYATEGYLYGWAVLKKPEYLETVKKAASYLQASQHRNGGISQRNQAAGWAADATAQAIRIWQSLDVISGQPIFGEPIKKALSFLKAMESPVMEGNAQGIYYTKQQLGRKNKVLYTWVSMFCASALALLQAKQFNQREIY
jgi:uncharacterized protein YyaL (SSP411 family)